MKSNEIQLIHPEHIFKRPKVPQKETDILFHREKKEDQYWKRPIVPTHARWANMSTQEKFIHVERERERHQNGLWFFNNGEPEYITGMHYDHLVYQTFDYKPKFLHSQRDDFYFREMLQQDKTTFGGLVIKPRRYGYTDQEVTAHQYIASGNFNVRTGMMSDTRDKVYSTLFDKLIASHIRRPGYMRANLLMRNGQLPKKKAEYASGKTYKENFIDSLYSSINPKALTVMGFDGDKLKYLTLDEIWKWTKVIPNDCWEKQKKTLAAGGDIIGKAMLLSTMGDDDSYEEAIKSGISMWHRSDPFDRDDNGQTLTGLYRYFVPGYYALHGEALGLVDKYGNIDIDRGTVFILNERKKFEPGSKDWTYEVRKFPLTIEEALGSALTEGVFDKKRLQERMNELKGIKTANTPLERITIINKIIEGDKPWVEGILTPDSDDFTKITRVEWEPKKDQPWLVSKLPLISLEGNLDKSNRWKRYDGKIIPPRNPEGVVGYDPVRYLESQTVSKSISQAAIQLRYKYDYYRAGNMNCAGWRGAMFLGRFDNPEDIHKQVLYAGMYWSFMINFERQVESFLRLAAEVRMLEFLMKGKDGMYGTWTNRDVWKDGLSLIKKRWAKPKDSGGRDYLMEEPFIPHLQQGHDFNPSKLTTFDSIISDIMVEKGLLNLPESTAAEEADYDKAMSEVHNILFAKRNR